MAWTYLLFDLFVLAIFVIIGLALAYLVIKHKQVVSTVSNLKRSVQVIAPIIQRLVEPGTAPIQIPLPSKRIP